MLISCGHCKSKIIKYDKVGKGGLLRLHIDRVREANLDLSDNKKALICPECNEILGIKTFLKREKKEVYNMIRGKFNTEKIY